VVRVQIVIEFENSEVKHLLQLAYEQFSDLSPLMREIAQLMRRAVEKNFEAEGRDESGRTGTWEPLAPSTQKQRARYKGPALAAHPILEYTGRLKQSLHTDHGPYHAAVQTGVKYGVFHQTGTRKMPARPFLLIPKPDFEEIEKYAMQWVKKVTR